MNWKAIREEQERRRSLLVRLDAGDELHREAAAHIKELKRELQETEKEMRSGARDSYAQGRLDAQEEGGEPW